MRRDVQPQGEDFADAVQKNERHLAHQRHVCGAAENKPKLVVARGKLWQSLRLAVDKIIHDDDVPVGCV